jgi:hypothetical protein
MCVNPIFEILKVLMGKSKVLMGGPKVLMGTVICVNGRIKSVNGKFWVFRGHGTSVNGNWGLC